MSMFGNRRRISCSTIPRAAGDNMRWSHGHTSSAGSRSLSLTKISAVQAVVKSVPTLSVCSRRSATVPPGRYWRSRRRGWPATVAIDHGYLMNTEDPSEEHINERVHWTVLAKRANAQESYSPPNLPADIRPERIAEITDEERALLGEQLPA